MASKLYCIYMHKNKVNNKVYIGQTCQSPERRWGKNGINYYRQKNFGMQQKNMVGIILNI